MDWERATPADGIGLPVRPGELRPRWGRPRAGPVNRAVAGCVALLAGLVLSLAASLAPDSSGSGTHQQLGLPPCASMMLYGRPCPTCGMTTAFAWFVRGNVWSALRAQVLGTVLAAATLLAAAGGAAMAVTGVDFGPPLRRIFVERMEWLYVLIVLGLASWGLKTYLSGASIHP